MAPPGLAAREAAALPRLLYIGDVSVADTMAGEALLFRLLQFYPPEKLAIVCGVRPGLPMLPGVAYHHWGPMFPRLLHSRVAAEYILWRAWRYFEVPRTLAAIATTFEPQAVLTISHVSGWLAAWQIAAARRVPLHMVVHDDFVYANRFPFWAQPWAERKFGEAYRAAEGRFCISDTMAEVYRARFGAAGQVIYPTYKNDHAGAGADGRAAAPESGLTFGYGGSINSPSDMDQIVRFARSAEARGHRLIAYTPQHGLLAERASAQGVACDARPPVHSDELIARLRNEADCLLLPQSLVAGDLPLVSTAFPTKWSDYSTLGLPILVWAPPGSSSARFAGDHPGCVELVTSDNATDLDCALARLESDPAYRRVLGDNLQRAGRAVFSPQAGWAVLQRTLTQARHGAAA